MRYLDLWDKLAYCWSNIDREGSSERINQVAKLVAERKKHRVKEKSLLDELMDEDDDY